MHCTLAANETNASEAKVVSVPSLASPAAVSFLLSWRALRPPTETEKDGDDEEEKSATIFCPSPPSQGPRRDGSSESNHCLAWAEKAPGRKNM